MYQQQQQSQNGGKYLDLYRGGDNFSMMYSHIPLSPMSMQSSESFDNISLLLSPKLNDAVLSLSNTVCFINDLRPIVAEYIDHQYQLQDQQQEQQQQQQQCQIYAANETLHAAEYNHQRCDKNRIVIKHNQTNSSQPLKGKSTTRQQQKLEVPTPSSSAVDQEKATSFAKPITTKHHNKRSSDGDDRATAVVHNSKQKKTRKRRITLAQLLCPTCFKLFTRSFNLKSHLKTHTKEKPFACPVPGCHSSFTRPHDLKRHGVSVHVGIKPYACSCRMQFARSNALKRHHAIDPFCRSPSSL